LDGFYARYAGGGARNLPFQPAMMVKVPVYGYATGVFSSRKIERRLHEDLAFRMLGAGNFRSLQPEARRCGRPRCADRQVHPGANRSGLALPRSSCARSSNAGPYQRRARAARALVHLRHGQQGRKVEPMKEVAALVRRHLEGIVA